MGPDAMILGFRTLSFCQLFHSPLSSSSRGFFWEGNGNPLQYSCLLLFSCQVVSDCDLMDCSMPGFPVLHHLLEFSQTHVHRVGDAIQPSCLFFLSSCLQSFPTSGIFQMSQFFISGSQSIGVSASASVLPMNSQDWFPLGWTGWISLQSKGLLRVFSKTTDKKHQFFGTQLSL